MRNEKRETRTEKREMRNEKRETRNEKLEIRKWQVLETNYLLFTILLYHMLLNYLIFLNPHFY